MASFELSGNQLKMSGSLDGDAEGPMRAQLDKLLGGTTGPVEVDMLGVDVISSICIGALVAFWIDLNSGGRTLKLSASPQVKRVLDLTGLTTVLMKQS
jgi:anti-anti-sigma factor